MPFTDTDALARTIDHREIFHDEMLSLVRRIMSGEMSPVMMAAVLMGLRVKKETIGEITAAAQVMREFSAKVEVKDRRYLVDIVGTGGDGSHTFNISTCSMFVAAPAARASASTATAASAASRAAPTCSRPSACRSRLRRRRSPRRSRPPASASCSRRTIIRR